MMFSSWFPRTHCAVPYEEEGGGVSIGEDQSRDGRGMRQGERDGGGTVQELAEGAALPVDVADDVDGALEEGLDEGRRGRGGGGG